MSSLNPGIANPGVASAQSFSSTFAGGVLSITGGGLDDAIEVGRNAAGKLLINGKQPGTPGCPPTVANTQQIVVSGLAGNDTISINETNGAVPRANLFGGAGNDVLTGGSGADQLFGQSDNDMLFGKGGNDLLFGGSGDDVLVGGAGADQMFGESGNDRMIWNPGDGSDVMDGGTGIDTAEVNGGAGAETFTIVANGTHVQFDRTSPAPFGIDISNTESLVLHAGGGNDVITASNGLAVLTSLTLDGGAGNDTINGGDGADILIGGSGNDIVDGNRGNDTADLGGGDDTFTWDPGDGSDTIDGGTGKDTMLFNGANIAEKINISADGDHARFTRDVAAITMDTNNLERIDFRALGGADSIVVNDLSATDVKEVHIDLAGSVNSTAGDGAVDDVVVNATSDDDVIVLSMQNGSLIVDGLVSRIVIDHFEATDTLHINGLGGDDVIDASALGNNALHVIADGGAGDDVLLGGAGDDELFGGAGDDVLIGGLGADVLDGGTGDNVLIQ